MLQNGAAGKQYNGVGIGNNWSIPQTKSARQDYIDDYAKSLKPYYGGEQVQSWSSKYQVGTNEDGQPVFASDPNLSKLYAIGKDGDKMGEVKVPNLITTDNGYYNSNN